MGLIAIIGGTGVCDPKILSNVHEDYMDTFYGTIHYWKGTYKDRELVFLPRHGRTHSIPPHLINYRANILGLKRLGVTAILSTTAVGSLNRDDKPGDFVLPDQFLDFTKCRHTSFFDGGENGVVHVDMTEPYCPNLRRTVAAAAQALGGYTSPFRDARRNPDVRKARRRPGRHDQRTRSLPGQGSGNLLCHDFHGH